MENRFSTRIERFKSGGWIVRASEDNPHEREVDLTRQVPLIGAVLPPEVHFSRKAVDRPLYRFFTDTDVKFAGDRLSVVVDRSYTDGLRIRSHRADNR